MNVCPNCGKQVKPGSRFCTGCGCNLEEAVNQKIQRTGVQSDIKRPVPKALIAVIVIFILILLAVAGMFVYSSVAGSGDVMYDIGEAVGIDTFDDMDTPFLGGDDDDDAGIFDDDDTGFGILRERDEAASGKEKHRKGRDKEADYMEDGFMDTYEAAEAAEAETEAAETEAAETEAADTESSEETEEAEETVYDPVAEALRGIAVEGVINGVSAGVEKKLSKTDLTDIAVYSACEILAYKEANYSDGEPVDYLQLYRRLENIEGLDVVNNRENTFVFEKGSKAYFSGEYALVKGIIDHCSRGQVDERSGLFLVVLKKDSTQPDGYLPLYSEFYYHEFNM